MQRIERLHRYCIVAAVEEMHLASDRTRKFFFFNDTATTEIYTLSLHDALPIHRLLGEAVLAVPRPAVQVEHGREGARAFGLIDRKSTRLNSSHVKISYAVF